MQRSRYAYEVHQFLPDGRIRYLDPFHAGKLRARPFDGKVPRAPDDALLVDVPEGTEPPPATITLRPEDVDLLPQPCLYGTREWVAASCRRQIVEGTFANLQTSFADFAKSSFVRVNPPAPQGRRDRRQLRGLQPLDPRNLPSGFQDEADAWALAEMRRIQAAAKDAADTGDRAAADSLLSLLPKPRSGAPPD